MSLRNFNNIQKNFKKPLSPGQLMGQSGPISVEMPAKSVKGLQKQGKAPEFPGQGFKTVKSLMRQ
jgi:hypothetical protein